MVVAELWGVPRSKVLEAEVSDFRYALAYIKVQSDQAKKEQRRRELKSGNLTGRA